jgi:replicative DNA helicase
MNFEQTPNLENLDEAIAPEIEIVKLAEASALEEKKGDEDYFPLAYSVFDKAINGGVTAGDLIVISGKSGHGKTTFAQTLTYQFDKLGIPTLWFSFEMGIQEIWKKFKLMGVTDDFISYTPLKIGSDNIEWIEKKILEGILKFNIKVVFIDHLGFLTPKITEKNAKDFERNFSAYLGQLVRQLKNIAREKNIIIFLMAHVRKTRDELDIDDLAHSVGIAQEADLVFMVERLMAKRTKVTDDNNVFTNESKITLVKNRRTGINKFIKCQMSNGRLTEIANQYDDTFGEPGQ